MHEWMASWRPLRQARRPERRFCPARAAGQGTEGLTWSLLACAVDRWSVRQLKAWRFLSRDQGAELHGGTGSSNPDGFRQNQNQGEITIWYYSYVWWIPAPNASDPDAKNFWLRPFQDHPYHTPATRSSLLSSGKRLQRATELGFGFEVVLAPTVSYCS
jgi:hypothetical protein